MGLFYKNEHHKILNNHMNEQTLFDHVFDAVTASADLQITHESWPAVDERSYHPDLLVQVHKSGRRVNFAAECKTAIKGEAQLGLIKHQLSHWARQGRPLLVTNALAPRLIDYCRAIDLDFMDAAGNCLLRTDQLWIAIRGNKAPKDTFTSINPYKGTASYAPLRVIYALLCWPKLLTAPYREVASVAGVSAGAVTMILHDLEERRLISPRDQQRGRTILDRSRLEAEWVTNYPNKLRPKLGSRRFTAQSPDWWLKAQLTGGAQWGGEVAAFHLTGGLRPASQTLYLPDATTGDSINQLLRENRLRADPNGSIEILQSFWSAAYIEPESRVVEPLLVYADLMEMKDSRAHEVAYKIRKEFLDA